MMPYRRMPRFDSLEDRRLLAVVAVDTLADTIDFGDGFTSLREAIFATNLVTGADTIEFAPSLTASGPATLRLTLGELKIADDLVINGPGAHLFSINAAGNDPTPEQYQGDGSRVFTVDDGSGATLIDVTLAGLTLTGGDALDAGGAILNHENLTILDCIVMGNAAVSGDIMSLSQGGAISHRGGALTVSNSTIVNNSGDFGGGIHVDDGSLTVRASVIAQNMGASGAGIYNVDGDATIIGSAIRDNSAGAFSLGGGIYNSGNMRIEATTISGNTAAFGGGVFSRTDMDGAEATSITNSTISGNAAFTRGGGVRNAAGRTTIRYSTLTGNDAPAGEGSGLASRGYADAHTEVRSTIIAGNKNGDVDFGTGSLNTVVSLGYNVIGTGNALATFQADGDLTGIDDPLLGALSDNGGPRLVDGSTLLTHALFASSPAINAGDPNLKAGLDGVPGYDQRFEPFTRVFGARIDVGAFEAQPNPVMGDYNFDGVVNAADYVQWQNTRGSSSDLRADGNGDGVVNDADRLVWMANFGRSAQAAARGIGNTAGRSADATAQATVSRVDCGASRANPRSGRAVGPWTTDPRHSSTIRLVVRPAADHPRQEFLPTSRSGLPQNESDDVNLHTAVLDRVFDSMGGL